MPTPANLPATETAARVLRHLDQLERCEGWTEYFLPLLRAEKKKVEDDILDIRPAADGTWNPSELIKLHAKRDLLDTLTKRTASDRTAQENVLAQSREQP